MAIANGGETIPTESIESNVDYTTDLGRRLIPLGGSKDYITGMNVTYVKDTVLPEFLRKISDLYTIRGNTN